MPVEGICKPERHLFVSGIGKPFTATTPYTFFKKILRQCGIAHKGKKQGPQVHDLRHTFAVHTLQKMATEGVDICMPDYQSCQFSSAMRVSGKRNGI